MTHTIKKILVTCALPYANGSIHLGHLLEHIQADIWVRYQRMRGNKVYFICADDTHGTPIMLKAQQLGIDPEKMINKIYLEHKQDLCKFYISYDNYHSTHSNEHHDLSIFIFNKLKKNGFIISRNISQLFDPNKGMFLPDRFVKGNCPECNSTGQYGDNCEICGAIYNPTELINPKSTISDTIPIVRESKHFFFDLPKFSNMLNIWICSGVMQKQIINKIKEWFSSGLKQWDISRDAPYFGFKIPGTTNKYFYVWLDATIGYMSSFKDLCNKISDINFDEFWNVNSKTELCHFIGKDIIYFHSLFWPAMLEGCNLRKPTNLFVHGYLMVNGTKMSKSRGTLIKASTYLKYLDADCLRYYYASKLTSSIDDIDLNLENFVTKVNTDIVNKIVNLASRNANFITKYFNGQLSSSLANPVLYNTFVEAAAIIGESYSKRDTARVIRKVIWLTDQANRYIDEASPWTIAKQNNYNQKLQSICSMGIELFRVLLIYLKPIVPALIKRSEMFLNTKLEWEYINIPLGDHRINTFEVLFKRINISIIDNLLDDSYKE